MARLSCPVCAAEIDHDKVESHIEEAHSNPDERISGKSAAEFIRDRFSGGDRDGNDGVAAEATVAPPPGPLDDIGIKLDDLKTVSVSTETGATLTAAEAKRVFVAVEAFVGFRIDRGSFVVNFVDWGIRNSFTEELAEAGGFRVVSHNTIAHKEEYAKVASLHAAINEHFGNVGTGRSFTFRRFGRYLAKSIPSIVETNPQLARFYVDGSPMSNRLGVPASDFLAVSSIFEYIKPFQKWSAAEKRAWEAHNRSVVKVANSNNVEFMPTDLRPSPSQAQTMVEGHVNDFGRRHLHQDYGKGASMWQEMIAATERGPRTPREGLGFSS